MSSPPCLSCWSNCQCHVVSVSVRCGGGETTTEAKAMDQAGSWSLNWRMSTCAVVFYPSCIRVRLYL